MIIEFPFIGASYPEDSPVMSVESCVNLYPRVNQAKNGISALVPTPGMDLFVSLGDGPINGMHVMGDLLFVVSGENLYSVTSAGVVTFCGGVPGANSGVSMAGNGTQICVVTDALGLGSIYSVSGGISSIGDVDYLPASTVIFFDGYFVFSAKDSGKIFSSALLDGTIYNGLDFATAESEPDNVVAVAKLEDQLWVFGQETTEIWRNVANTAFPFSRVNGMMYDVGCGAKNSIVKMDSGLFWLGSDGVVYRTTGGGITRISTHPIEISVSSFTSMADAVGSVHRHLGHMFYVITFPTGDKTWVYDVTTNLWHERKRWKSGRHRASKIITFKGEQVAGDYLEGKVYRFRKNSFTDNGEIIQRERTTATFNQTGVLVFYDALELNIQSGVGLVTGQGEDPQIMMQFSDDDGQTWSNEFWKSMGKIGQTSWRVTWRQLGSSRKRTFRVRVTDPVNTVFVSATLKAIKGLE